MPTPQTHIEDAAESSFLFRRVATGWLKSAADVVKRGEVGRHSYWDRAVILAREAGMREDEIPEKPEG